MRFVLDAGLASMMKGLWAKLLEAADNEDNDFVIFMLADSSPRVGKDWLLCEIYFITDKDIAEFFIVKDKLKEAWLNDDKDLVEELQMQMSRLLRHHIMIPTATGVGHSGLGAKWASVVWGWRVETANWRQLARVLLRVFSITTDFGTESMLASVPKLDPNPLFPHWRESCELVDDGDGGDDSETVLPQLQEVPVLSFDEALPTPGTEHICHNAIKHVTDHMLYFKPWLHKAKAVHKMLADAMYQERFTTRCMQGSNLERLRKVVMSEIRQPLDHRFMSVLEFLQDILPMMNIFMTYFLPLLMFGKLTGTDEEQARKQKEDENRIDADAVSKAILSKAWWVYGIMLCLLHEGPEGIVSLSRSCTCHAHRPDVDDQNDVEINFGAMAYVVSARKRRKKAMRGRCVARGLQAPAFATGVPMQLLGKVQGQSRNVLLLEFQGVDKEDSDNIIGDYDKGTAHLRFEIMVKISLWQQLPLYLCAMGHDDAALAVDHLRKAIGMYDGSKSSARHCKFTIQYLGETSKIRPHIERFIESNGQDVSAVFRVHANRCKLVRTNEISVESLHRQASVLAKKKDWHGAPALSFDLRGNEGLQHFTLQQWAESISSIRNPHDLAAAFQLHEHEALVQYRDKRLADGFMDTPSKCYGYSMLRQVFYKVDGLSLFKTFGSVDAAYGELKKQWEHDDKEQEKYPLLVLCDADPPEKKEGLVCRYAMKHFKERADETHVYSIPKNFAAELVTLQDVLTHAAMHSKDDDIRDDGNELLALCGDDSPLVIFRIVNMAPKKRKVFMTA